MISNLKHMPTPHRPFLVLVFCLMSAPVFAQDSPEIVEPTEAQYELNEQGVQAAGAGKFDEAILLFEASLRLGELNITYLNKGRVHYEMGECEIADEAFLKALEAPAIPEPPPERIRAVVERFRQTLQDECLEIDLVEPAPRLQPQPQPQLQPQPQPADTTVIEPIPQPEAAPSPLMGYLWIATGGAAITAGILLDTLPATAQNYEFDAMDLAPIGMYTLGSGLVIYGVRKVLR